MVGDMVSSCPLHISKVFCVMSLSPAISKHPRAFLYGWLPLSNAYGISSIENKSIIHFISEFFIKEEYSPSI